MDFSRRSFIKTGVAGSLAVGGGGLLAACGTGASTTTSGNSTSVVGKPKKGGTLRLASGGGSTSDVTNPLVAVNVADFARTQNIYEPLIGMDANAQPTHVLAESLESDSTATTWTLRVRKGVTFHNGKPLTADDVIYTFQQIFNPKVAASSAPGLASIDVKNLKKLDTYTVSIPCTTPFATLEQSLAIPGYSNVVPVGFDAVSHVPKDPIGTGPFKVDTFTPAVQTTLSRYDGYWQTGKPYLDGVVLTEYTDETSQVNALLAGQVDLADQLSADVISELEGQGKKVLISTGGAWNPFTMRVDTGGGALANANVRQAMRYIVDRKQMLELVFGGYGTIGNDIFGIWSDEYNHSLPQREQDIDKAKFLLKQAGAENLTIKLTTAPLAAGVVKSAQVFAQQAAAAGINVKIDQVTVTDFFGASYLQWPFAQDFWFYNFYIPQVSLATLKNAPYNETHWNNPQYTQLYTQAIATTNSSMRTEIAHQMQQIEYDEGGYIIPFFSPNIDAYAPNVQGLVPSKAGLPLNAFDFKDVWFS